jgi:predicted transcriptional regulator
MSTQAVEILIKNIKTDPEYYPRFQPDQERIKEFVEAMECGEYFPPVKVAKGEGKGVYILLDGKHRLEAKKLLGETKTLVNIFPVKKEHWLMTAARFNSKSSKPLHPDEIKKIIIESWHNGIKDTAEIAEEMGRTVRYIEMVLKPVRDEERDQRDESILKLHQQGMSQRQISSQIGITQSVVNKSLKLNSDHNKKQSQKITDITANDLLNNDEVIAKRNDFVLRSPEKNCNFNNLIMSAKKSDQIHAPIIPKIPEIPKLAENDKMVFSGNQFEFDSQEAKSPSVLSLDESWQTNKNDSEASVKISAQTPVSITSSPVDTACSLKGAKPAIKKSPFPTYLDQIDFYHKLPKQSQHAMRTMELARTYKLDIIDMTREINEPVSWIRKILIAAIAIVLMPGNHFDIASSVEKLLGINFEITRCIQQALPFKKMLCPVSPDMEDWMANNISERDLKIIATLVNAKTTDLLYLIKGALPPPKKNYFEELPDNYKDHLQSHVVVLRELRNHAKNQMFNGDSAKQLMVHLNKNVTVINEIFDGLREVNMA